MGNTQPVTSINVWVPIGGAAGGERFSPLDAAALARVFVCFREGEKKEKMKRLGRANFRVQTKGGRKEGNGGVAVAAGAS